MNDINIKFTRDALKQFIDTINAAKIKSVDNTYLQFEIVEIDLNQAALYVFEVLAEPIIVPPSDDWENWE